MKKFLHAFALIVLPLVAGYSCSSDDEGGGEFESSRMFDHRT